MKIETCEEVDARVFSELSSELQFIVDADGRLTCLNAALETALGRSADECEGLSYLDLLHPDDVRAASRALAPVFANGERAVFQCRVRGGDDTFRWMEWRVVSPDGASIYAVGRDVTDYLAVEQSLRASRARLRESQRVARVGHYSFDIAGNAWTASRTLREVFGIDDSYRRDLAGWLGIVHPEDRVELQRYLIDEVVGDRHPFDREYRIVRVRDGAERWVHGMGSLTLNSEGTATTLFGVIQDVTRRKLAELSVCETNVRLERMVHGVAEAIGRIVEARDPYTQGHELGVARLASAIAVEMGLEPELVEAIEMAALVHDIGKLSIPAEILTKPGTPTDPEFALIREHSRTGYEILKDIDFPWPVADIVLQHHERMDGSGYPGGIAGDEIRLEARVLAVADVVEAMASHRPYRPSLGLDAAVAEVCGNLYDQAALTACSTLYRSGRLEV